MNQSKYTFVFAGNASYRNRGCEAIVRGTTTLLREQVGESRFISSYFAPRGCDDAERETDPAIIHRPFTPLQKYSLTWFENWVSRKFFKKEGRLSLSQMAHTFRSVLAENQVDAVLMLGGDNYSLDYGPPDRFFKLNEIALEQKIPLAIWGASIGPFSRDRQYEQWAANALKQVTLICARETETQAYLASIGVTDNVMLTADPAFFLQPAACTLPDDVENALCRGGIGVNLAPLLRRFTKINKAYHRQREQLLVWQKMAVDMVHALATQFASPIVLIPHVMYSADSSNNDYLFLKQVADQAGKPGQIVVAPPNLSTAQSKWLISRVKVFAGTRTHSTLAAISSGVPTICIGYSLKAKGIAKDVYGHLDWYIDGKELIKAPDMLIERLKNILEQEIALRSYIASVNPVLQERARDASKRFIEMISI